MKKSLAALPCFNNIKTITPITLGLSQSCFKVTTKSNIFFAKSLSHACLDSEIISALHAAENKLSPAVVFHDNNWLITEFVDGKNLSDSQLGVEKKSTIALTLMAKFHQLEFTLPTLEPDKIMSALINSAKFNNKALGIFKEVSKIITDNLAEHYLANHTIKPISVNSNKKSTSTLVNCHGDVNFSNIILLDEITKNSFKNNLLVDFECACAAPAEFDLAMFIAINNINKNNVNAIIKTYQNQHNKSIICQKRLKAYLYFSYFINGLWYLAKARECSGNPLDYNEYEQHLQQLAIIQFQAFDQLNLPKINTLLVGNI